MKQNEEQNERERIKKDDKIASLINKLDQVNKNKYDTFLINLASFSSAFILLSYSNIVVSNNHPFICSTFFNSNKVFKKCQTN